jgi:hypothetical protein
MEGDDGFKEDLVKREEGDAPVDCTQIQSIWGQETNPDKSNGMDQ